MRNIRVLVVDDSALVRQMLSAMLEGCPDIEVVGVAADPYIAREKIKALNPDVLTLDVEMPRMDGLTFLANLMRLRPMPVVMVSSLTEQGAEVTLRALELGAIDFVTKPKVDLAHQLEEYAAEIIQKVKVAAQAHNVSGLAAQVVPSPCLFKTTEVLLAIGASTGGTEAIRQVLSALPPDGPGTVITQHIPEAFSAAFARRLDEHCPMRVAEARDGDPIVPGHAYVAPGDSHLLIQRSGTRFSCRLSRADPVGLHRPSVDVMFASAAEGVGQNAIGVLLTGMGADGARGLLRLREAGASTIAQDEATSVIWGMPGAAVRLGAAEHVLPLMQIPESIGKIGSRRWGSA